jgi:uncharacterized CHY-type Zn-finger protein
MGHVTKAKELLKKEKADETAKYIYSVLKHVADSKCNLARKIGVCIRCEERFDPKNNIVKNPLTNETKVSALCKSCRKIVVKEMNKEFKEEI